jgi:hypothetical protein
MIDDFAFEDADQPGAFRGGAGELVPAAQGPREASWIGRDGRILWRGHPLDKSAGRDLRSRIDAELKK